MLIISNQILIDFLRLNNRASNVCYEQLGKQLDEIIILLGGTQYGEIPCSRNNEGNDPLDFSKTSMNYNFPSENIQLLFNELLNC